MLGIERLALIFPDDQRLSLHQILDWKVGRIAAVAKRHRKRRRRLLETSRGEDAVNGDTAPLGVELRPSRHAVNVNVSVDRTKRLKLLPVPRPDLRTVLRFEREGPQMPWSASRRASGEHRKIAGRMLARRDPAR